LHWTHELHAFHIHQVHFRARSGRQTSCATTASRCRHRAVRNRHGLSQ